MAETVLVTGGTGFVAGWCMAALLQRGYAVRTTVRSLSKADAVRRAVANGGVSAEGIEVMAADLGKDEGWDAAMAGVDYVLHVASPLGGEGARSADELVRPAREGALRALRAAVKAGVKRVVMTSSCAAVAPNDVSRETTSDETVWSDPKRQADDWYRLSKTLAERAAWDFMQTTPGSTEFATVLPAAIFGPVLSMDNLGSVQVIQRLVDGRMPGVPNFGVCVVDVRDVADLHLRAMTAPEAAGERFIAAGEFLWMRDIANILRERLGERGRKVPTRALPDFVIRFSALTNPALKAMAKLLGRKTRYSSAKAERLLGWTPRPAADTVTDCAESLLANAA